ncbi:2,4-dienoyl-CoA reductase [Mesobacillus persicus]|uniref:2,4-dienoyl-CoA reductase n=1 Tax=Mesobacillus persicus TaxID=930146 RepID=A0A1H8G1N0_9BACI|nr:NAD(P)/FAD-dependent oxidoreductase [Mesobacillus persicus]SEN37913.1 2,4-dienoyl-CoA reductase [Mesobacillus persicus]
MNYPRLFEEGRIGKLTLKNRLVMPGMGTNLVGPDGEVTDHQIAYYEERAKGGTGLIIVEFTTIDNELGKGLLNQLRIDEDRFIPGIQRLANAVKKYGAKIFVQIHHAGRQSNSGLIGGKQIVAPSPVTCKAVGEEPRELTTVEVKELVNKFIMGAVRCKTAGVDGVEVHGAHGYLINQFLSPNSNRRNDEYGGSFENRMRFLKEIVLGIKEKCGQDFPVTVRLSVDEFEDGGIDIEQSKEMSRYLEEIGVDAIHASAGTYHSMDKIIESPMFEQGWRVYLAEEMKTVVDIPVITVGVIRDPAFAEKILADGRADFIAMGRSHIADPEWAKKAIEGREQEIRKCINCLHCIKTVMNLSHLQCSVNVRAGRELEFTEFRQTEEKRHVTIVGGGPGGMETARVLSLKGYDVTIFEKDSKLGGQLNLVTAPVSKEKMNWMIDYHSNEMKRLNVDVRLNTVATIDEVKALNPYAVFLATGAKPIVPDLAGNDLANVWDYEDVYLKRKEFVGQKVIVVGSGMVCYSVTSQLAKAGNDVTLIDVPTETGSKVTAPTKAMLYKRMKNAGVEIVTDKNVAEVRPNSVVVEDELGISSELAVDHVVFAMGTESYNPLEASYREHFDNVFVIGDAINPGSITNAIRDGFEKAYVIEDLVVKKVAASIGV